MLNNFAIHLIISSLTFAILVSGFKFFVKLKGTIDFSYMAIVIFASYIGALLNVHFGLGILASIFFSLLASLIFTFFTIYLSSRLTDIYFSIGTLAFYILAYQLAYNLQSLTGGALGISFVSKNLIGNISLMNIQSFLIFAIIVVLIVFSLLFFFRKTYFYKVLTGWGENEIILKSLGVKISLYKFVMILITTTLAVIGGNMFSYYYLYIHPSSFWLGMLGTILMISFVAYRFNDWATLLASLAVIFFYEYLRFFKFIDPTKIGYFREMIIAIFIVVVAFIVFRKTHFAREN